MCLMAYHEHLQWELETSKMHPAQRQLQQSSCFREASKCTLPVGIVPKRCRPGCGSIWERALLDDGHHTLQRLHHKGMGQLLEASASGPPLHAMLKILMPSTKNARPLVVTVAAAGTRLPNF